MTLVNGAIEPALIGGDIGNIATDEGLSKEKWRARRLGAMGWACREFVVVL